MKPTPSTVIDLTNLPPSPKRPKKNTSPLDHLRLNDKDMQILSRGGWLTDKHINAAQHLLASQYGTNGLQDTLPLYYKRTWASSSQDMVQILYLGGHWVCASTVGCSSGTVEVFDSFLAIHASYDLQKQLACIMKTPSPFFTINHVYVQRQIGSSDCGLFSIAFAIALCQGQDPSTLQFNQSLMRSHLKSALEAGILTQFPTREANTKRRHRIYASTRVDVYCVCRAPWSRLDSSKGGMIQCHSCNEWFHEACVNLSNSLQSVPIKFKWICELCFGA